MHALLLATTSVLAAPPVLTPEIAYELVTVGGISLSPSGLVAYERTVPRAAGDEPGKPGTELHVVDLEGNSRPFSPASTPGRPASRPTAAPSASSRSAPSSTTRSRSTGSRSTAAKRSG